MDLLGRQMVKMQVDVVGVGSNTTTLKNLHGHGARDDITRGQIFSSGSIALHEALTLAVSEDTTFTTAALSHEAASTVNTSRVELNELGVLDGEASSSDHTTAITSAGVGACAAEVGTAVATSRNDGLVGLHAVDGTVGHVVGHDTAALTVLHDQVHGEVLDEENAVVAESATEERVKHRVTSAVGDGAASVGLTTLAEVSGLATEGTLVDLAVASAAEGHTVGLKLAHGNGRLTSHVLDGVLVTEPVGALHCVVEVVAPVIGVHVAEGSVNTSLCSNSMGSGREELGDASRAETSLRETKSSTESSTTSTDNDGIVSVVDDGIVADTALALITIILLAGVADRSVKRALVVRSGEKSSLGREGLLVSSSEKVAQHIEI
mmetsp:Transcript_27195/g.33827  ORF Transcript_27195/g.33827 Transcript_27195/m.33827 type:complete len:379 (-) Transcript_27195:7-1143(-)